MCNLSGDGSSLFFVIIIISLLAWYLSLNNTNKKKSINGKYDSDIMNTEKVDDNERIIKEYEDKISKLESENQELKSIKEKSDRNHKRAIIIISAISVILLFIVNFALPYFIQGNTILLTGGENNPIDIEYTNQDNSYFVFLYNFGLGISEDIALHIKFPSNTIIYTDATNKTISVKPNGFEKISDNECYYYWDYVNSGETISMALNLNIKSDIGNRIYPDITIREK